MINQMEGKNDTQYINPQVVLLLLVIEEQHVAESGAKGSTCDQRSIIMHKYNQAINHSHTWTQWYMWFNKTAYIYMKENSLSISFRF